MTRLSVLLILACQGADLSTFGLAAHLSRVSGEIGPLGVAYRVGGFGAVAAGKIGTVLIILVALNVLRQRKGDERLLRLLVLFVAGLGIIGAASNVAFGIL